MVHDDSKKSGDVPCESEDRFWLLFKQSPLPYQSLDPDGRFIEVNDAWLQMLGYDRDEVIGHLFGEFIAPEYSEVFKVNFPAFKAAGETHVEFDMRRKDGSFITVAFDGKIGYYPDGSVRQTHCVFKDITERKRADELIKILAQMADNAPASITVHDLNGNFIYANDETLRLHGHTRAEYLAMNLHDIDVPESKQLIAERMRQVQDAGEAEFDVQHFKKDGSLLPLHVNVKVIDWGKKKVIMSIATDLTQRKRAEAALTLSNRKLNLLSSITRHDINNQILALNGFLELLRKEIPDPKLERYFNRVGEASNRIFKIIQFTKEYEKIGVNTAIWQDCHTLVDTVAKQAPLGQINVKNDIPAGTEVFADPLITKVCYNLMDNAVRHGGKITTIRFSVEKHNDHYSLICEDDGDGVIAEEKELIFERGFGKNNGLGLALAREILDITGITIHETGEPGRGARFEMTVPKEQYRFTPR